MRVLILSHRDVLAALPPRAVRGGDGGGARRARPGRDVHAAAVGDDAAGRGRLHGADARLARAARRTSAAAFALKAVCIMPGNPARGLDAHQGLVTLFDGETGVPTAILDASAITEVRTAAVTAVATGALARPDASTLAILGAGHAGPGAPAGARRRARVRAGAGLRAHRGARPPAGRAGRLTSAWR